MVAGFHEVPCQTPAARDLSRSEVSSIVLTCKGVCSSSKLGGLFELSPRDLACHWIQEEPASLMFEEKAIDELTPGRFTCLSTGGHGVPSLPLYWLPVDRGEEQSILDLWSELLDDLPKELAF